MRIKYIKLFALFYLIMLSAVAQRVNTLVNISGILKNFSNAVQVEDISEFEYLLPVTNNRMIIPDSSGHFSIQFKIASPNYFRIGRNILYLTHGDNLKVFIDFNDPMAATFSGRGSQVNMYLRNTPFPKAGSFIAGGGNVKPTPKATVDRVLQMAEHRKKELGKLDGVSTEFKKLEDARIKADVINSLKDGEFYTVYMLKLKGDTAQNYLAKFKELTTPVKAAYSRNFVNASFMKVEVYRGIANKLTGANAKDRLQIKDWYKASQLVDSMQLANDKQELKGYQIQIAGIKTVAYRKASEEMLHNLLQFGKGDFASDFNAKDINGNEVRLSSMKGKTIYVDLWATWCGPCMEEMPHFEDLKENYKKNPAIVFVSLSIDDDISLWHKSVSARKADGYQWNINRNKLEAYNIVGIPRVLLINKNFKIADMNGPLPSSPKAIKAIEVLLK